MAWEHVLIRGVTPIIKADKKASILIHGREEGGDDRKWSCFPNHEDDAQAQRVFFFSGNLDLALACVVPKLSEDYGAYIRAIKSRDAEEYKAKRQALKMTTSKSAAHYQTAQDELSAGNEVEARKIAEEICSKLRTHLVGRVIRVLWNTEQKYPGPDNNSILPLKRSSEDGKPQFGGFEVSELLEEFASKAPRTEEQKLEATLEALAEDEEHDAELESAAKAEAPAPAATPAATTAPSAATTAAPSASAPAADAKSKGKGKPAAKGKEPVATPTEGQMPF